MQYDGQRKTSGIAPRGFCVLCYLKGMRVKCGNRDVPDLATYEGEIVY